MSSPVVDENGTMTLPRSRQPASARAALGLDATPLLAAVYRAWVPVEEDHLAGHFGEPYRRYRDAAPRWLGRPIPRRSGTGSPRSTHEEA